MSIHYIYATGLETVYQEPLVAGMDVPEEGGAPTGVIIDWEGVNDERLYCSANVARPESTHGRQNPLQSFQQLRKKLTELLTAAKDERHICLFARQTLYLF